MKIRKMYVCPVCKEEFLTKDDAQKCKSLHKIEEKSYCECEICGEMWDPHKYNVLLAQELAKECEREHKFRGEIKEKSNKLYFSSHGIKGRYYPAEECK